MHVAFFLAYLVLFRISYIFQTSDLRSTPWNPEAGIAVVSGIVLGWSSLPAIFLASLASKLTNPTHPDVWLGSCRGCRQCHDFRRFGGWLAEIFSIA